MTLTSSLRPRLLPLALATGLLGGCVSFSPDGGLARVDRLTREHTGQGLPERQGAQPSAALRERSEALLAQPLSADSAVALALLNNRGLQADLAQLGVAEADLVQAGRPSGPKLSLGRLALGGGAAEIERAVMVDLLGLLSLPRTLQIQQDQFHQAQLRAAQQAVALAAQTRIAFYQAVAAQELLHYQQQVQEAAEAASELALRMHKAGNFSRLDQLREQAFAAESQMAVQRARQAALAEREQLLRLLGLPHESAGDAADPLARLRLPERLPTLPEQVQDLAPLQRQALAERLDMQLARLEIQSRARVLGLTQATRYVNALELGYRNKSESGAARANGYELELSVPLFDAGAARNARAQALYLQSVHRGADLALRAASQVREAHAAYRSAHAQALHFRDELLPLRKRISEENLLRYNGMLISVFELLADAREQVRSVADAVQAQRDYWVARTRLDLALSGAEAAATGPQGSVSTVVTPALPETAAPAH